MEQSLLYNIDIVRNKYEGCVVMTKTIYIINTETKELITEVYKVEGKDIQITGFTMVPVQVVPCEMNTMAITRLSGETVYYSIKEQLDENNALIELIPGDEVDLSASEYKKEVGNYWDAMHKTYWDENWSMMPMRELAVKANKFADEETMKYWEIDAAQLEKVCPTEQ